MGMTTQHLDTHRHRRRLDMQIGQYGFGAPQTTALDHLGHQRI